MASIQVSQHRLCRACIEDTSGRNHYSPASRFSFDDDSDEPALLGGDLSARDINRTVGKWESLFGGTTTNRKRFDRGAFSQPASNFSLEERSSFVIGNGLFRKLWVTAPVSTKSSDGLGLVFNARACQRCHLKDGRGHTPENARDSAVSMFLRLSIPAENETQRHSIEDGNLAVIPEPTYGGQLQDLAISGFLAEGRMVISY